MQLQAYLDRVGFAGAPRADLDTLTRLHHGHLNAIPYENLDVLLGVKLDFDMERIFDKLVTRRRGGWCYEMNGLFAWALEEIGFELTRLAGAVHRIHLGDRIIGNHLVLLVELDRTYVADVGFGDGLHEPVPLAEGEISQHGFVSRLEHMADGWWRYHNHQNCGAPTFDFRAEPADPAVLVDLCSFLQTNETSPFLQNAILQRRAPGRVDVLRNSVRMIATPDGLDRRRIESPEEFVREVRDVFGVEAPEIAARWPLIQARGEIMLAENPL